MVETHTRILGIAPYDGMRTAMEQAAQAYPNVELEVYTGDLEEGQAIVQRMAPNSYDCIISRGGTATLIRQVTDLPVVDIHISVYDVLRTMKLAENYTSLYAIVGFPSITEPAHTLCSLLNFDLDILTVRSAEEVRHTLERLKQGGYRMVVCDMVTHTIAREMGFDAFLITSGIESLHSAIDQAVNISTWFGQLRQENLFLRSITQEQGGRVVVMEPDGSLYYNNMKDISPELHRCLQTHLREIPATGSLKFYYTERSQLYSITAQVLLMNNVQRYLFYCVPSRIPLHSNRPGLRSLNKGECEYLFSNSFYSLSGAMGTQDAEINALAAVRQPLFICGEPGTGKEQIARYLYLHSALVNRPLVVANCALMNDKSWDFLLNHYNSPLNANGNTVYFQNFEAIPEQWSAELLAAIEETGLARRAHRSQLHQRRKPAAHAPHRKPGELPQFLPCKRVGQSGREQCSKLLREGQFQFLTKGGGHPVQPPAEGAPHPFGRGFGAVFVGVHQDQPQPHTRTLCQRQQPGQLVIGLPPAALLRGTAAGEQLPLFRQGDQGLFPDNGQYNGHRIFLWQTQQFLHQRGHTASLHFQELSAPEYIRHKPCHRYLLILAVRFQIVLHRPVQGALTQCAEPELTVPAHAAVPPSGHRHGASGLCSHRADPLPSPP